MACGRLAYDGNGNRTAETQSGPEGERSLGWSYDADDRLVEETLADAGGSRHRVWTLDGAGNRLAEARSGTGAYAGSGSRTDTLNARQQVVGREETGGPSPGRTEYEYDADGQRTARRGPEGSWAYTWNVRGQLVAVERDGRLVGAYRYDADGQREEKATAAGTRRSLWLEGFAGIDTDEGGRGAGRYEAGPDGRTPVVAMTAAAREYLHVDALGSVTLSTGGGGVVGRTAYGAWGEAETTGASGSKFGYTGHQADAETGLIYFKARYYDPGLGAFVSPDRLEGQATVPASWGQYRYANGNPFAYIDKNGDSATAVGTVGGFFWGFGQMVGAEVTDAMNGEIRTAGDYLGLWTQNIVAGAELGLAVDAAVISGGAGVVASGAVGSAGLGALTLRGRGASAEEFAKQQTHDALAGALLGGILSKAAPLIGKAGSAIAERTPEAVKNAAGALAEKAAGLYESSGTGTVVANLDKALSEGLVKEGGKKELAAEMVPGVQRSVRAEPSPVDGEMVGRSDLASSANSVPDPYSGIRQASQYLQDMGVSRADRVRYLQSFESRNMAVRQAGESEFGLRYFSDSNRAGGQYLFETFPASRSSLAIKPEWSTMSGFRQFQIRPGVTILEGRAAAQGAYLPGGQIQKFVLDWRADLIAP